MVQVKSRSVTEERDMRDRVYLRTNLVISGTYWEGPEAPGQTGRYVQRVSPVSHAKGRWGGCSAEFAHRHGLDRHVA